MFVSGRMLQYSPPFAFPCLTDLIFFLNTSFLALLQVKNVDFDGLFGNISSVIDLSQRLLEALQETDYIG